MRTVVTCSTPERPAAGEDSKDGKRREHPGEEQYRLTPEFTAPVGRYDWLVN